MITYHTWSYQELYPLIGSGKSKISFSTELGDFPVSVGTKKFELLRRNRFCVQCKIEGTIWKLQSHQKLGLLEQRPHLNLYAVNERAEHILMTQDHIFPRSAGGSDDLHNLQTMCAVCNNKKADNIPIGNLFNGTPSNRDPRNLAERSLRIQRIRTLSAYADFLAYSEKRPTQD